MPFQFPAIDEIVPALPMPPVKVEAPTKMPPETIAWSAMEMLCPFSEVIWSALETVPP